MVDGGHAGGVAGRSPRGGRVAAMRFVDPAVLSRIGNLELVSRLVVDGFISGLHQAVFRGASVDFAEHRAYVPGDDVRRIDWKLFARTDRLYLKTFEAETNADVMFALDLSRSMDYSGGGISKLDYARFVVGCLAHLAGRQRDRVGLAAFDGELVELRPPSVRRRDELMRTLNRLTATGPGDICQGLEAVGRHLGRRGIVVVVSDFYAPPEQLASALDGLRLRGQDVVAIHVMDPVERDLSLPGAVVLEDLETGRRMPLAADAAGDGYRVRLQAHCRALGEALGARRIDYARFVTDQPLDHLLHRYLSGRARSRR